MSTTFASWNRALRRARRAALAIRYEDGAWPRWRVDQNVRYALKSRLSARRSVAPRDSQHHHAMAEYLARPRSLRPGGRRVRIGAVGDVMWIPSGTAAPFSRAVQAELAACDLRVGNLETPVDPERPIPRASTVRFNAPVTLLDSWPSPTVLSLVNNHALDQGIEGLVRTRSVGKSRAGLIPIGGTTLADATATVKVNGVSIAFLGMSYAINPWGHGVPPADFPQGIPLVRFGSARHAPDWALVEELLAMATAGRPDIVVALPHWGYEYELWPDERMRRDAYRLVEMGVDVILGSSPHVLQPVELVSVDGWDGNCPVQLTRGAAPRAGLIAYSLGNFTSSLPALACNVGAILGFALQLHADGSLDVHDLTVHGTRSVRSGLFGLERRTCLVGEHAESARATKKARVHLARLLGRTNGMSSTTHEANVNATNGASP